MANTVTVEPVSLKIIVMFEIIVHVRHVKICMYVKITGVSTA